MNFERGQDVHKALQIGKYAPIRKGMNFVVKFELRNSCPEYYPLQNSKNVIAKAVGDQYNENFLNADDIGNWVHCEIETIYGVRRFQAHYRISKEIWVINDDWD